MTRMISNITKRAGALKNEAIKLHCRYSIRLASSSQEVTDAENEISSAVEKAQDRKVPVFTTFTKPTSSSSIYSMEEALEPYSGHRMTSFSHYGKLSHTDLRPDKYAIRAIDNLDALVFNFPQVTDFMILGSGLMGSAVAYYLKKTISRCADVCVLDKDPYSPHNVTSQCNGLLSFQSKNQDHVRIATLSKELLRNLLYDPIVTNEDISKLNMRFVSHLVLWRNNDLDQVLDAVKMQACDGCHIDIKLPRELESHYPFLNVSNSDVAMGTFSNQDELIIDPIALRNLYRVLAQGYGANFIQAEVVDYDMVYQREHCGTDPGSASSIVARLPTGELKNCFFGFHFLSLGHNTPYIESRAIMGCDYRSDLKHLHFLQPRFRINFSFSSFATPVLNFPAITDTDGSLLINEDIDGSFRYYLTLEESEKILVKEQFMFIDMENAQASPSLVHRSKMLKDYFNDIIKPRLVKRVPSMADAEFNVAFSGFQNYNLYDSAPIISLHPYFVSMALTGGFGSRLMSYAPAAAISIAELLMGGVEDTFDCTNYSWNRVISNRKVTEFRNLVA